MVWISQSQPEFELTSTCLVHPLVLLQREELTEVILKLLMAWKDPLWHFHQSMAHQHDFNNFSSNKALEMSDMVHELRKGVEKVAEKVLSEITLVDTETCSYLKSNVTTCFYFLHPVSLHL